MPRNTKQWPLEINCGFARTAIRELTPTKRINLDKSSRSLQFKQLFDGAPNYEIPDDYFNLRASNSSKFDERCEKVLAAFSQKWRPTEYRSEYMSTFSTNNWRKLDDASKAKHTISDCDECYNTHQALQEAFPVKPMYVPPENLLQKLLNSPSDLPEVSLSKRELGTAIYQTLSPICQNVAQASLSDVLHSTPKSGLQKRMTKNEQHKKRREVMRKVKNQTENQYKARDCDFVLQNRISWKKFNDIRLEQSFESREAAEERVAAKGIKRRWHGTSKENLDIDQKALLEEASTWEKDKEINYSEVARRYGLTTQNGGQSIKEFLEESGVRLPAKTRERERVRRKRLKLPGGEISQPQHSTVQFQKAVLADKIDQGEYNMGRKIEERELTVYRIDKVSKSITEEKKTVTGRLIPLTEIRQKLLHKHTNLGFVRCSDFNVHTATDDELATYLQSVCTLTDSETDREKMEPLALSYLTTRYLKMWHDHSEIAGHSHLIVSVSVVYNSAFYYTAEELEARGVRIDIETVVEQPELHILARSGSSDAEQSAFNSERLECVKQLKHSLDGPNSTQITDVLRFFHGDKPAQQFEAGNNRGGHYPCVTCDAQGDRFNDISFCHRCDTRSLADRQEFMLGGILWRQMQLKPFDNLRVDKLRSELQSRGMDTTGQLRHELDNAFRSLRRGIVAFPALLLPSPEQPLEDLSLQHYEVCCVEPLHDFKGHMANLFAELPKILHGSAAEELGKVKESILNKTTLRCVDYRKATILLSSALRKIDADTNIVRLIDTAVELCEILYSKAGYRTPRSILRLHNISYVHGNLCVATFAQTRSVTTRRMFGNYFHSLVCHSALTYRQVNLRSLNTEYQERMFGQASNITKQCSNNQPQHVIDNATLRIQAESTRLMKTVQQQEGEVKKLAATWNNPGNTFFSFEEIETNTLLFQSHLERISDYLLCGPGVWWKQTTLGIEFLDSPEEPDDHSEGPKIHNLRSNLDDIQKYLKTCWEKCTADNITLPLATVRLYTPTGDLGELRTMEFDSSDEDESEVIVSNGQNPSANLHAKSTSPTPKAVNQADSSITTRTEPLHLKASQGFICIEPSRVCFPPKRLCFPPKRFTKID